MNSSYFIHLPRLFTPEELLEVKRTAREGNFVSGKNTARLLAKEVKNNLQLEPHSVEAKKIDTLLNQALNRSELFRAAAIPKKVYPPLLSKYSDSMHYGHHVDSPVMGTQDPVRTDLALTVFISDPSTYSGGELVIRQEGNPLTYKLPAGDALLYPASYLHGVNPVTYGERIALVSWVQSGVRDPQKREALFQLNQVHSSLIEKDLYMQEAQTILQLYSNLFKRWIEL